MRLQVLPHMKVCTVCGEAKAADPRIVTLRRERDEALAREARLRDGLRQLLDCKGSFNGTVSERGGEPAVCTKCSAAARALLAEDDAALTAGGQPEEARHRGESRNPQGVLDGNANPAPAVSAEDGAA